MVITKYKFDWYNKFWIKLIDSICWHEGYGGKRFYNKEYGFTTDLFPGKFENLRHIVDTNIPYILRMFEKVHLLNNGDIPDFLNFMKFEGVANKINVPVIANKLTDEFNETVLDAKIMLMVDAARQEDRSVVFQRRIPWELQCDDDGLYSVYGRFATGTI